MRMTKQYTVKNILAGCLLLAIAFPAVQAAADDYGAPGNALAVTRTIKITALESMKWRPSRIDVRPGQTVKFVISNPSTQNSHEFLIDTASGQQAYEARVEQDPGATKLLANTTNGITIPPATTRTFIWHFPDHTGTLQYACHEPLHFAAGMIGEIHITSAAHK